MIESQQRTIRLLVDLQACQTEGSAHRGVGRFSSNLFENIRRYDDDIDIFAHVADYLPYKYEFNNFPESRIIHTKDLPTIDTDRFYLGGEQDKIDDELLSAKLSPYKSDIIHVSHVFEGFSDRVALPSFNARSIGQIYSATLYDMIPFVFPEFYLQNEHFRKWYQYKCNWLRQADLLLSISESSRVDAINYLGLDPNKIVTIHGGVSSIFTPANDRNPLHTRIVNEYGLKKRFILYTGGDDFRKNIERSIEAFGLLPNELQKTCSFVIVCAMGEQRKQECLSIARSAGIPKENIIFTGRISDDELVDFYRACDLFIFPSLYEGLGLPVLEAMACGAPVIGSNSSSIKELIARPHALFDPKSKESIAEKMVEVLSTEKYENELREFSLQQIKNFSWEKSAKLSLQAYDDLLTRRRENGILAAKNFLLPKKRLAMFTPLPPIHSGIADYNAHFLPYLANHFDIDLFVNDYIVDDERITTSFRVFNVEHFKNVATKYDAILYEFGNSEFHIHMLPYLKYFPGIVGLHDAFLNGMFGYIDFNLGKTGSYTLEMVKAHGTAARTLFAPIQNHPDAIGKSMIELPCTKSVLDNAIGIISHSPFNLNMARSHYPEGWQAPYRIIPQMISFSPAWENEKRNQVREQNGFAFDDFIITTFGHIAWTKWGDRLLEAFLKSSLVEFQRVHLVFAGELARDDFGIRLKEQISKSNLKTRIHITGYLSESEYDEYLNISDLAVQLRTKSRGGTPKGVLDCLSHGLPVIVNNDASFTDYPEDVVYKLSADPTIMELVKSLEKLFEDKQERSILANKGLEYVKKEHNPNVCAAAYASAINEFIDRQNKASEEFQIQNLAPHIAGCQQKEMAVETISSWIDKQISQPSFSRRKIYIDVSFISTSDSQTGIARVVKETVKNIYLDVNLGYEPIAVEMVNNKLCIANNWLSSQGLITEAENNEENHEIEFQAGDVLLMLDASLGRYQEYFGYFEKARQNHVEIVTAIYDLLPITLPKGNIVEGGKEWFEGWVNDAIQQSDGLVCISKSVALEVLQYIKDKNGEKIPRIGYWHLGSDFISDYSEKLVKRNVRKISNKKYLLMIGTIEPRKSHALVLSAMEKLWDDNFELSLCIAGKKGWMVDELFEKLINHPLLGKKLFLFESVSDIDINYLYKHASGLLFLSKGEGFGLPLIEAANYNIPILCSDLPVFHEIAGEHATYIKNLNLTTVVDGIAQWWEEIDTGNKKSTKDMPRLSWKESAKQLMNVIINNRWINE